MASVKLLVKKHNVSKKDGKTPIYIQYNYSRDKRILINTHRRIELKYWDFENDVLRRSHPKYDSINRHIKKTKLEIESIVSNAQDDGVEPSPEYILNEYYGINQEQSITDRKNLFEYFEDYIKAKSPRVGKHTVNDYHALKKHLNGYERWSRSKLDFKSINYSFYQKFMKYLSHDAVKPDGEKGLAVNTIGKTLKNLKIFLRDCGRKNIIDPIDTSDFKVYQEDVENIYLTKEEINFIYKLDLSEDKERERIRDLFVLGCYTGLRYSDLSSIKSANIKGDFIYLRQGKTMNNVVIPLNEAAKKIIEKYNGGIPEGIHMNDFNKQIKGIAKDAGIDEEIIITQKRGAERVDTTYKKFDLIASHTCRRSFCTNEYLKGTPTLFIMKISGHRTERNFLKYIKVDEQVAAQKMLEFWKAREG
jgi:integrase